jgi:hypothetical protein
MSGSQPYHPGNARDSHVKTDISKAFGSERKQELEGVIRERISDIASVEMLERAIR